MWRECVGEGAWVVVHLADRVRDDVGDGLGIFVVEEEIGGDPGWSRDGQAPKLDPLSWAPGPDVESDVRAPRLASRGDGELTAIRGKVADAVQKSALGPATH